MINKTLGSIFVAAGTAIGAGMLALPLVSAGMGFAWATVAFIGVWAVMWFSGLLTLEVTLAFKSPNNHYATMARGTLGRAGEWVTVLTYMLLLYSLISAYISGGAAMLEVVAGFWVEGSLPHWANALIFTIGLGLVVTCGTRVLDYTNRGLFFVKLMALGLVFVLFFPHIDVMHLVDHHEARYLWVALPVIITAFGFHIVIPSLSHYLHENVHTLKRVLLWGSLLPLVIYLLWLAALIGILPLTGEHSFATLAQEHASVAQLMVEVKRNQPSSILSPALNLFAELALVTSFLGVSLGLFDFFHDKLPWKARRNQTALITFIPPLVLALFYPNGFVQLLSYASIFVAMILVVLPAVMVYRLRRLPGLSSPYRTPGGNVTVFAVGLIGIGFIVIECARIAGVLPVWVGS